MASTKMAIIVVSILLVSTCVLAYPFYTYSKSFPPLLPGTLIVWQENMTMPDGTAISRTLAVRILSYLGHDRFAVEISEDHGRAMGLLGPGLLYIPPEHLGKDTVEVGRTPLRLIGRLVITVPAGKFEAYEYSLSFAGGNITVNAWYHTTMGILLKLDAKMVMGNKTAVTKVVLLSIRKGR